jgi:hypothetical protein
MNSQNTNEEIQPIPSGKNQTWQNNHNLIYKALIRLLRQTEQLPTAPEIAAETGLSCTTIYKHLAELDLAEMLAEEIAQFKLLSRRLLGKLADLALDGDIRALRLSLQTIGLIDQKKPRKKPTPTTPKSK